MQRVAGKQFGPVQVAQRLSDGVGEVRLRQHQHVVGHRRPQGDVLGERPLGPQLHQRVDRNPAEVVAVEPVPPAADQEIGARRPRLVDEREVRVPWLRLVEREEVPRKPRVRQIPLQRHHREGVQRGGRSLVGLTIHHESRLSDHLARSWRRAPVRVVPRRLGPRVSAAVLLGGDRQVQQRHEAPHVVVLAADDHRSPPAAGQASARRWPRMPRPRRPPQARGCSRRPRGAPVRDSAAPTRPSRPATGRCADCETGTSGRRRSAAARAPATISAPA